MMETELAVANIRCKSFDLGRVICASRQNPTLRHELGSSRHIWEGILCKLQNQPEDYAKIMSLIASISACDVAGPIADETGVVDHLLEFRFEEMNIYWAILSNVAQTIERDLTNRPHFDVECFAAALKNCNLRALKFLATIIRRFPNSIERLFPKLWVHIKQNLKTWFEDQSTSKDITQIIFCVIETGQVSSLMQRLEETDHILFLQCIEASLANLELELFNRDVTSLVNVLAGQLKQYIPSVSENIHHQIRDANAFHVWRRALLLLGITNKLLTYGQDSIRCVLLHELKIRNVFESLCYLLIEARELSADNRILSVGDELNPCQFPMIKTRCIPLISALVENDKERQDFVRECGALPSILECCMIDANNPFAREHAIICIRYLLENNQQNQNFIAKLERKTVVEKTAC